MIILSIDVLVLVTIIDLAVVVLVLREITNVFVVETVGHPQIIIPRHYVSEL